MIIECNQCNKKFKIDQNLIPTEGRYVQCGNCQYRWFYKIENEQKDDENLLNEQVPFKEPDISETIISKKKVLKEKVNDEIRLPEEKLEKEIIFRQELKKNNNNNDNDSNIQTKKEIPNLSFLSIILVIIISFISIILVLDTFKSNISFFLPNIDFLLTSLYETINDIFLFIKDLI